MAVIFHTRYVISSRTRSDENKPESTIHKRSSGFLETWFNSYGSYCYQGRVDIQTLHMGINSIFTILITCRYESASVNAVNVMFYMTASILHDTDKLLRFNIFNVATRTDFILFSREHTIIYCLNLCIPARKNFLSIH